MCVLKFDHIYFIVLIFYNNCLDYFLVSYTNFKVLSLCTYCKVLFVMPNSHKRKHTGEKPYKCSICCGHLNGIIFLNFNILGCKNIVYFSIFGSLIDISILFVSIKVNFKRYNIQPVIHQKKHTGENPYICSHHWKV